MTVRGRKNWTGPAALAVALLMFVVACVSPRTIGNESRPGIAFAENVATPDMLQSPFKALYEDISPSVVGIEITTRAGRLGGRITTTTAYVGSGVVISDDGYVLTNQHVVNGAEGIYVVSGENAFHAEYIAGDASSDVALLLVSDPRLPPPAKLGNSDALSVGDWALVVGNPLGEQFANTLTIGVISGLGRDLSRIDGRGGAGGATNLIQTNAAINAGNSGGGLFNIQGELVGVTSMKLSNNGYFGYASIEGIGLAIPINHVKNIVASLIAHGRVLYPRVGITMQEIVSSSMEPSSEVLPRSLWVTAVEKGSPAEQAGLRVDDLIVEVDGARVVTSNEVQTAVREHAIGETVSITVYRIPGLSAIRVDEPIPEGEYLTFNVEVKILELV
ncbi:MAG: trypsin-like peptidase domain-containing protein [Firmicutes bacterium]|nr:trypsin-like peptidase domain-containing protein [Bacillota bacterium]